MKKLEKVLWAFFIIGLIFKINHWPFAAILTVFSLGLVSSLYFYFGFGIMNNLKFRNMFKKENYSSIPTSNLIFGIGFGISLSMLVIGFLFKFMLWSNANFMLLSGIILVSFCILIYLIFHKSGTASLPKSSFIRVALISIIGISFYIIKTDSIIDFYYQDTPEYAEALKKVIRYPENIEYRDSLNKLREKRMLKETERIENNNK